MHKGACLCGAVTFEINADLPEASACHCDQCRRWTGHYLVSTEVKNKDITIHGEENVSWFKSSEKVRRGFCSQCGSVLFFDAVFRDWMGVSMGAIDKPTHTQLSLHIFAAEKGDYYELTDGLPQNEY